MNGVPLRPSRLSRRRRLGGHRGQGLVEFALVVPVFFLLLFSSLNGGFLLYAKNAMGHIADVGMVTLAAEGNYANPAAPSTDNADQVSIQRMRGAGLDSTALVTVSQIVVTREVFDTVTGTFRDATATDPRASECTAFPCQNVYTATGSASVFSWPPANRSVTGSSLDYAKLAVSYTYRFFAGVKLTLNITDTKLFGLEPQT